MIENNDEMIENNDESTGHDVLERIEVGEVVVPGRGSASVQVVSEKGPFQILNMVVDAEVARDFLVTDVKVGKNSQLVSTGAIHASYFAQRGEREDLMFNVLQRGGMMTIDVQNASEEPRTFAATLRGILEPKGEGRWARPVRLPKGRYAVGFGSTLVRSRTGAKVYVQPQVELAPDCLIVPPETLESFKIVDLRVVGKSVVCPRLGLGQEVGPRGEVDVDRPGEFDFAASSTKVGDWVTVEVLNETDVDRFFRATVTGRRVDHPVEARADFSDTIHLWVGP